MKMTISILALALFAQSAMAATGPVKNVPFTKMIYLASPAGDQSGRDYSNAKSINASVDLMAISAGMQIENVYVVVDYPVAGVTAGTVGDDDAATGFLPSTALSTYLATKQTLGWNSTAKGSYLKDSSTNPQAKLYTAAGKEVKWVPTGAQPTGDLGKIRVIVTGLQLAQ